MKIKTSELTGATLDWAVATAGGYNNSSDPTAVRYVTDWKGTGKRGLVHGAEEVPYSPSRLWSQGGPIIEREFITLINTEGDDVWSAYPLADDPLAHRKSGPTPLIAAMRCYVASKLGDEVEVPDGLV